MNRIKKVFTLTHFGLWMLFSLLVAFLLSQNDADWIDLTKGIYPVVSGCFLLQFLSINPVHR
ncbi:MAG TPA: hypothetical protein VD794_06005 [Flavisolibacter sp.]|nr:hypothetical protein [Flavisolibacter sp.]